MNRDHITIQQNKEKDRKNLERAFSHVHHKHLEGFFGEIRFRFEAGRIVLVTTEEKKKPEEL